METGIVVGIIGAILTIISLGYAIYAFRTSHKEKKLTYDILPPTPIADAVSKQSGYSIKIVYEGTGESRETVNSVILQYVRFTNFGRIPISKEDLTSNDPLRVEIDGANVLDINISGVTRDVCNVSIQKIKEVNSKASAIIDFDFLDHLDGGIIQIVTDSPDTVASLKGTIIGMPDGLIKGKKEKNSLSFPELGCVIPLILQIAAIISVPYIYKHITGGWENAWTLLLPIAALIIPLVFTIPLIIYWLNRGTIRFPEHLNPPEWYRKRSRIYNSPQAKSFEKKTT
ncbi:MAG: hypothetical protein CL666_10550 [Balneola sp.]|nr:hypothetical protein [Balneola sp.]|tara:strand:- start:48087 stop:48941 length:855 start_codon:yes stop_codon:yes gene_type:complete